MHGQAESAVDARNPGAVFRPKRDASMRNTRRTMQSTDRTASPSGLSVSFHKGRPVDIAISRKRKRQLAGKRVLDIVLSLAAVVFLMPLLLGVILLVVLTSRGPVFFKQVREGLNGEPFAIYKFRSMYVDRCDASGVAQTKAGDARLTPIGRLLRRTSIDELPQLLNVLKGDMSLIGPRPHVYDMLAGGRPYRELVPYYAARHAMKPGISGWAQANGLRGPTDDPEVAWARIDHDIAYIQNFSLLLDLKIIWLTLRREFLGGSGM